MGEKLTDKIKYFIGVDQTEDYMEDEPVRRTNQFVQNHVPEEDEVSVIKKKKSSSNNIYDISSSRRMKVVVHRPTKFEESEDIVHHLLGNKPVILNLSELEEKTKNKVFNFCSGALCALKGHMIKVDAGIFLLAPNNIDVSGDIKEELESKGMFSWT